MSGSLSGLLVVLGLVLVPSEKGSLVISRASRSAEETSVMLSRPSAIFSDTKAKLRDGSRIALSDRRMSIGVFNCNPFVDLLLKSGRRFTQDGLYEYQNNCTFTSNLIADSACS